ncbi:ferritin heavy chain-like [Manis pentadactyla]|uniref:ferritin heavy chain-like n=1 Tax=Manis pentadactyla TaxID=143292 RepID=UPI00255C5D3B|nr:ferritin heavy chain-like [Manis pentadactyla]XP_057351987.1 ferritin heavy chain-like [Manis pentadactyla]
MPTAPPWQVHQNYDPDCEAAVNRHIDLELHASNVYLSMAFYCERDDVALERFAQFFLRQSGGEREQAERLMHLQNQRGGRLHLRDVRKPDSNDWESGLRAVEGALVLQKRVNQSLLDLHRLAAAEGDAHLCEFLHRHHLHHQVEAVRELEDHLASLHRMEAPEASSAENLFDKLTLGDSDKN